MGRPSSHSGHRNPECFVSGRAFSLVELLVVIGIIAILISLAVVTGTKVVAGSKARASEDIIRVLDESRGTWMLNWGKPVPQFLEVPLPSGGPQYLPMIDARPASGGSDWTVPAETSLTYFTALVLRDPMIRPVFEQIDSAFVKSTTVPAPRSDGQSNATDSPALVISDAWGRPFRFVHPAYHGGHGDYWNAQTKSMDSREVLLVELPTSKGQIIRKYFRRSYRPFSGDDPQRKPSWVGDADEGMCIGGTPYFYSAGDDGDPGTRADNVYSTKPRFPVETRDFE